MNTTIRAEIFYGCGCQEIKEIDISDRLRVDAGKLECDDCKAVALNTIVADNGRDIFDDYLASLDA